MAFVRVGRRYPKRYQVATHGMTPRQFVAHVKLLEQRHDAKEAKIDALQAVVGREFSVNLERFRITAATVTERGTDAALLVQVSRRVGEEWKRMPGMPIVRRYAEPSGVPDAAGVELIARDVAERSIMKELEREEFATEVAALLGE